jgi:hypothetical protein
MKKILLSVLALLALAGTGTAQTLPSYVPANGLVGWWPFNGNANDESGNNNNGTVNGATLTADRFGNAGKAYGFDGVDDFIEIIHHPSLNLPNGTINLWFKTNSNNRMCLFNKANFNDASNENYNATLNYFSPGVSGIGYFSKYNSNCLPGFGWVGAANSLNFSDGTYHMISCITSSTSIQIFVDAILQSSIAAPNAQADTCSNSNLRIGQNWTNYLEPYIGDMDDIAIYNRALSPTEITQLYTGQVATTANCPTFPASLTQGLVGYWPFCGNALDESGNNNHGTVNGATLTTDRFGNAGSAYGFDGVNDKIEGTLANTINSTQASGLTISGWMWLDSNSLQLPRTLAYLRDGTTGSGYTLMYDQVLGRIKGMGGLANQTPSMEVVSNNPPQVENWVFVSMTCDLISNTTKFFINSILQESTSEPLPTSNLNEYGFGKQTLAWDHLGSLDDIAIWNRALTPQEIQQVYNQGICQTSITVTDTLLIHTGLTSYNPVAYGNTLKVWPNPGNTAITLDAGNLSSISLSTWGGNGIYYLHLINPQGHAIEIKKIVLAP